MSEMDCKQTLSECPLWVESRHCANVCFGWKAARRRPFGWRLPFDVHRQTISRPSFSLASRGLTAGPPKQEANMYRASMIAAAAIAAASPETTSAATIDFSGSATATASPTANVNCAPLLQGVATGTGTSSFGSFSYSHTACTTGATGPVTGTYLINFGVDQFSGGFVGTSAATATAGLFDLVFTYNIDAGTGRFAGGTGSFSQIGTVDVRGGPPSRLSLNFAAVPEPATWAMMLLGFAGIGVTIRRRQAPALVVA